ncbi:MAG: prolipoprotein diacylglyceryl transferase [Deltaproteobacteria bacterium]|nr:prolipoprotein diacylglyceryl transferase [Deltaproteobacteria bacterium]
MHPVLFRFGPFEIRFYGLMYVAAILVGSYLIKKEVRRKNIPLTDDEVMNFILLAAIGGIIGARAYYVIFNMDYYAAFPKEIPAIWHGGLAIHGGLAGGIIAAWVYLRKKDIPFWRMGDAVAPALILGQAFGRFGNFMNGDAHGSPTTMPWGIIFPAGSIAGTQFPNTPTHPAMLYEMAINMTIFAILWFKVRERDAKDGFVFALYIIMYSAGRFLVESFRADSLMLGPLRTAQMASIILIVLAGSITVKKKLWRQR